MTISMSPASGGRTVHLSTWMFDGSSSVSSSVSTRVRVRFLDVVERRERGRLLVGYAVGHSCVGEDTYVGSRNGEYD